VAETSGPISPLVRPEPAGPPLLAPPPGF